MSCSIRTNPVVSVVMPVFNVAPFVRLAVESVLKQTLADFEMVVVDDGSTDGTMDALQSIDDSRLEVVTQENAGSSAARNAGARRSQAPYIAFIDGDDLWSPKKLAVHIDFMKTHPGVDLTFSHSSIINEQGNPLGRFSRPVRGYISFRHLLIQNVVHNGSAVVARREALEKAGYFDTSLRSAVDHDLWLRVALIRSNNVYCIPQVLTFYRMREGQITKDWRRMQQSWKTLIEKLRRVAGEDVAAVEDRARAHFYRYLAYIAYESQEYIEAASLLRAAVSSGFRYLICDRGMWLIATALMIRAALPQRTHRRLDHLARQCRSHGVLRLKHETNTRRGPIDA
jgi:glycosyltransferase involved in cell wall biosynthesis